MLVAELRDREARSKKLAIKEFKSLEDFQDTVEMTTSKYFGKGFNHDLLEEEEEAEKKRRRTRRRRKSKSGRRITRRVGKHAIQTPFLLKTLVIFFCNGVV